VRFYDGDRWPPEPKVRGSNPLGDIQEVTGEPSLTNSRQADSIVENQELVSGLFSEQEIDPGLEQVIASWPQLSPDLRKAILRIAVG